MFLLLAMGIVNEYPSSLVNTRVCILPINLKRATATNKKVDILPQDMGYSVTADGGLGSFQGLLIHSLPSTSFVRTFYNYRAFNFRVNTTDLLIEKRGQKSKAFGVAVQETCGRMKVDKE